MKKLFTASLLLSSATCLHAVVLASDDFSYTDGNLVGNTPPVGNAWANHSGSGSFIQVASGAAVFAHGGGSREDANISFAAQTAGLLTATFDLIVNDDAPITGSDSEYFAHFFDNGGFNFRSRIDIVPGGGGGDYTLGLSTTTGTAEAIIPVDFSFGDTVAVSLVFDIDNGTGSLTAGGNTVNGISTSLGDTINAFAFRQSGSSSNETITVDNLVITTSIPEPSTALLGTLGLLALYRRKR